MPQCNGLYNQEKGPICRRDEGMKEENDILFMTSCLMSLMRQQPDAQANRFQCTSLLLDLNFLLAAVRGAFFHHRTPISNGHLL